MGISTDHWKKITRGCAEIISESELKAKLEKPHPLKIKLGVDPTAPDLHLGHLVVLRKLKDFQDLGHQIEFIIGDFTARIGDPSGRSETRPLLQPQEIWEHAKTYQDQVFHVLDQKKTRVHFNSSWLNAMGLAGMLELSRHATVAQMLHRADFRKRFDEDIDITILEFLYPILQGYDSYAIQSDLELGGTDQKFNLLMGREIQRDYKQEPQVVMMMPLLEGIDGVKKMSKSYGNYIAFNDSPKEMFGKLMSIPDPLMPKYFELLTDLDVANTKTMHPKDAKVLLAKTLVSMFHGEQAAESEANNFDKVFSKKEMPDNLQDFALQITQNYQLPNLLADAFGLSKNEARRLLEQGAVEVDGKRADLNEGICFLKKDDPPKTVQVGKRRFVRFIPSR